MLEVKIPTILALASSNEGVAIIATSFSSKPSSINPAIIFSLLFVFANLVKIFAVVIGSEDKAAAVGPLKYFSKSLIENLYC